MLPERRHRSGMEAVLLGRLERGDGFAVAALCTCPWCSASELERQIMLALHGDRLQEEADAARAR